MAPIIFWVRVADRGSGLGDEQLHYEIVVGSLRSAVHLPPLALILMSDWYGNDTAN